MLSCPWKKHFDFECLGCGMQRSIIYLLEGNLAKSFHMYPALLFMVALVTFLALHLKFKFKNGHKVILVLFSLTGVVLVSNYVMKFI